MRIGQIAARIPLTLSDVVVLGGAASVAYGLWLTFGLGPTLIVCGGAAIWVGGLLSRGAER